MPPTWPRRPTRRDPEFRRLDDRYTLGAHAMIFLTIGSGAEFLNLIWRAEWAWIPWLIGIWGGLVAVNAFWVLVVARYPDLGDPEP